MWKVWWILFFSLSEKQNWKQKSVHSLQIALLMRLWTNKEIYIKLLNMFQLSRVYDLLYLWIIIPRIHSSRLANLLTTREKCGEWCLKSDRSMPVVSSCTRAISEVDWMNKTSINIILNTFSQFGYFDDEIILPWVWWKKKLCKNFFQVTKIRFISDFQLEKVLIKSQKAN